MALSRECELPPSAPDEARVRLNAIGLNFSEIDVGRDARNLRPGERVCFAAGGARQSYAEAAAIKADALVATPPGVDDPSAAALMLKRLTCDMLLAQVRGATPGETLLVSGAAGGVGHLLCQGASHPGASDVGVVWIRRLWKRELVAFERGEPTRQWRYSAELETAKS